MIYITKATAAIAVAILITGFSGCASGPQVTEAQCEALEECTWVKTYKAQYRNCLKENGDRIVFSAKPCNYRHIGGYAVVDGQKVASD